MPQLTGRTITKMMTAIGATNKAEAFFQQTGRYIKGWNLMIRNNTFYLWGADGDVQEVAIDAPDVDLAGFIDHRTAQVFRLIGKNAIDMTMAMDDEGRVVLTINEHLDSGTCAMSIVLGHVACYRGVYEELTATYIVDADEDDSDTDDSTDTDSAPDTDTDDDAPWQTIYTGPYTIHTDTDSMTFEWRSEAESMADLLTANGTRITLDWNYRPITIGEIVGINTRSYTPSPRWAVIGVMRNRLGLIVYVLQNEDGVTQQYYGLSILRLQPNTYHVPVVDILTVDIATAHLAEYMVNMHNMHPQMCNAMHDDLMSDMLDDLLDAKWREVTRRMHATPADDAPERLDMMFEYEAFAEWVDARKMALEYATACNQKHPL